MMFMGRRMRLAMRKRSAAQSLILKRMPRFKLTVAATRALPSRSVAGRRHALER